MLNLFLEFTVFFYQPFARFKETYLTVRLFEYTYLENSWGNDYWFNIDIDDSYLLSEISIGLAGKMKY